MGSHRDTLNGTLRGASEPWCGAQERDQISSSCAVEDCRLRRVCDDHVTCLTFRPVNDDECGRCSALELLGHALQ